MGFLLVGLIGCEGAYRIKVETAYGPGVKFEGNVFTYAWAKEVPPSSGDVHSVNPQTHELVRSLVEQDLTAKGYRKVTSGAPDVWLDYGLSREMRGEPYGDTAFPQYAKGSLVLYIIDPESKQWIWRGWARARVDEVANPAERKARLQEAVSKMLADIQPAETQSGG